MEEIRTGTTIDATQMGVTLGSGKQVRLFVEWEQFGDLTEFMRTMTGIKEVTQYSVETIEIK